MSNQKSINANELLKKYQENYSSEAHIIINFPSIEDERTQEEAEQLAERLIKDENMEIKNVSKELPIIRLRPIEYKNLEINIWWF